MEQILSSKKIIIPGVGAFDHCMSNLKSRNFIESLNTMALDIKIPILGICVGMQMMCQRSEEGNLSGLGWVDADVKHLSKIVRRGKPIPHMGWNVLNLMRDDVPLFSDLRTNRFYFVHSYYVHCNNESNVIGYTNYDQNFVSAFNLDNIYGVQFHPEKSHKFGMKLIQNFARLPVV